MPLHRAIPVVVTFNDKSVELAISRGLAEACARQLPIALRESAGEAIAHGQIEGQLALELSRYVDHGPGCETGRAIAAEDAAYLVGGMLSPGDWADAQRIELHLHQTASRTRLDLRLVLTRRD